MKKSTYIYLGALALLFVFYFSVTSPGSGLALFIGEFAGTFALLYLLCMGVLGIIKIGSFIVSKLKKTD